MEHLNRIGMVRIRTPHPEQAAVFLRQHLWCEPVECRQTAVRSGDFEIEFVRWDGALDSCEPDAMLCGLRHIALEADDIHEALDRCRARELRLQTAPDGGPRLSQKVYGTGLRYFNVLTDFGVVIEVTEKHPGIDRCGVWGTWESRCRSWPGASDFTKNWGSVRTLPR